MTNSKLDKDFVKNKNKSDGGEYGRPGKTTDHLSL